MSECWKCKQMYKETDLTWVNIKHKQLNVIQLVMLLCDKCKQKEIDAKNVAATTKTSSS